ncbi:acetate--CoA ligase family protein [Bradyrhizobium sp. 14AA]
MLRLERLLRPNSIAVIGKTAAYIIEESIKLGFSGEIWPVHPTKDEVAGHKAYRSVADLPGAPDAAFLGVNRQLTIEMIQALAARGAGGAICYASGFRETSGYDSDGEKLQAQLVTAAGKMPFLGPNSLGVINYADGAILWAGRHGGFHLPQGGRGIGIVTQSGNLGIDLTMQRRGLPIAFLVSVGNQAQVGLSEAALSLIEDDRLTALGLYIEAFDSVAGFEKLAARARELKKPIVALKAGRSDLARQATVSHTASLTGSDAASGAFLKRLGIGRVDSIPAFVETLKLLHVGGPVSGYRLSSMSWSGGDAMIIADSAEGRLVHFPPLTNEHRARVESALGPLVAVANPLDYNNYNSGDEQVMTEAFTAMLSGGFDLNMLLLDIPRADRCSIGQQYGRANISAFEAALKAARARGAMVATLPENIPEDYAIGLMARGVTPLCGISEALEAAQVAASIGLAWREPLAPPLGIEGAGRSSGECATLDEAQAKARLSDAGLPVPKGGRASNGVEAIALAKALGFPVALKALGVAHKSEVGAVRLNLKDADAVSSAARDLSPLARGLYVERMVGDGVAELIVGFTRDPVFGPVMTLGTGGVMVELLRDTVTVLLPATRDNIEVALRSLRLYPLLDGYRGKPKADINAAINAIAAIADFVRKNASEIEELDINPLIVCAEGKGAFIADALLVLGGQND